MSTETDFEIENKLLNSGTEPEIERPLSPILNSSRPNIFNRKIAHKKSRVKLMKRFELEKNKEKSVEKQIRDFNEESFSLAENEDFINCLDRLEEIERNREVVYKVLLDNKKSNLTFKKPTSPAPKRLKSLTSPIKNDELKLECHVTTENQDFCEKMIFTPHTPIALPKTSNFQTATGKIISIPQENIEKHSKLFEDILNSSQSENRRKNKYNSLKKLDSAVTNVCSVKDGKEISLTQEICDSGISDTQFLFAVDNVLNNNRVDTSSGASNFKGFNKKEIEKSVALSTKFKCLNKDKDFNCEKRKLDEAELFSNKKLKLDSGFKNLNCGFSSASGKHFSLTTDAINKAKHLFSDLDKPGEEFQFSRSCDKKTNSNIAVIGGTKNSLTICNKTEEHNFDSSDFPPIKKLKTETGNTNFDGFSRASGQKISIDTTALNKTKNNFEINSPFRQADKDLQKSVSSEKKAASIKEKLKFFDQLVGDDLNTSDNQNMKVKQLQPISDTKTSKSHALIKDKLKYFDNLIGDDRDFVPKNNYVSPQASRLGNNIDNTKSSSSAKNKLIFFDKLLGDDDKNSFQPVKMSPNFGKFSSASGKSIQLSNSALKQASGIFDDILDKHSTSFTTPNKSINATASSIKKKLGLSSCRQISIPDSKLQKAKLIFDEDLPGISPIRPLVHNFNPQGFNSCSTPVRTNFQSTHSYTEAKEIILDQKIDIFKLKEDSLVTIEQPIEVDVIDFEAGLKDEIKKLEENLTVFKKRQEAIEVFKREKADFDKKPKEGVLYKSKLQKGRVSFKTFVGEKTLGQNLIEELFCITPKTAADIHFKESAATVLTADGATVIPNIKNLIGVVEIERAFKAMDGVDPKLIPKGWIKNHYKWIIWKLASYERMFPVIFKGCLNVDHVVQQLKYRYDREIDKVERSALRKIMEKDDAPQKRMVLCVSDINKLNSSNFELELTDGWYGIRAVIDEPLCHQILNARLTIGTKLITCGAELMNCDGCHPLDVTALTHLKLNFNCTRRAKWDTRLGYQKFPGPFSMPIHTVHPNGGPITSIDICIARVYPFRYLDKSENKSVWRNIKAEERQAQEWENERYKRMERIEDDVRKEFKSVYDKRDKSEGTRNNIIEISNMTCPKTLLEVMENSNDPDSVQELLTPAQKSLLLDYKRDLLVQKQQEMQTIVKNNVEKLKMVKREVIPIMKLLVVDLNGSPTKGFNFFLWRPSECHVQMLKEEKCMTIYNVLPKTNGDLYSTTKTVFKEKPNTDHISLIFKRKLIPIEDLNDLKFSKNFSDFDTVGIIVETSTKSDSQEIWLCDISGRLLLIKIFESPASCLLLDNLKRGQATSVCNLVYRDLVDDVVRATGNHFTVFSSYPKYKHLQNGLEEIKKGLSKDFDQILDDCNSRIEKFKQKVSKSNFSIDHDENDEDSLMPSRITSTDIALSLIDMDKFT